MSAWRLTPNHVAAIVAAATDPKKAGRYDPPAEREPLFIGDLCRMLDIENAASILHRYPTADDEETNVAPLTAAEWHRLVKRWWASPLPIVDALKALASYEYQSCEHDGWKSSKAREWCNDARKSLCGSLPGWDASQCWSIDDGPKSPAPVRS